MLKSGKINQKRIKRGVTKNMATGHSDTKTVLQRPTEEEKNVDVYKFLAQSEERRLRGHCRIWEQFRASLDVKEEVDRRINSVIREVDELIENDFGIFLRMIENLKTRQHHGLFRGEDVKEAWVRLKKMIAHCDDSFSKLHSLKANDWSERDNSVIEIKEEKSCEEPPLKIARLIGHSEGVVNNDIDSLGGTRIVFETLNDLKFTLNVEGCETIKDVTKKAQDKMGVPENMFRLISRGRLLQDVRCVADYGIQQQETIFVIFRIPRILPKTFRPKEMVDETVSSTGMRINLNIYSGGLLTLNVDAFDTIGMIKTKMQKKLGIPKEEELLLSFSGHRLENNRTLSYYRIRGDDRISIFHQVRKRQRSRLPLTLL